MVEFFTDDDGKVRPIGEGGGISSDEMVENSHSKHTVSNTEKRAEILNKKAKERKKVSKEEFDKDVAEGKGENVQVIEPIGFLDSEERLKIEDYLGDKLEEKEYDVGRGEVFTREDGREYMVFKSEKDAHDAAIESLENLYDDIGIEGWNKDFRDQFITMTDTDRRISAGELADMAVDDRDNDDILDMAVDDRDNDDILDMAVDEGIIDEDQKMELEIKPDSEEQYEREKFEEDIQKLKEKVRDKRYDAIYEALKDPIQYFVHDEGMYSLEDLMEQSFITVDKEKLFEASIDADGIAHTLASYDGDEIEVAGMYLYRTN